MRRLSAAVEQRWGFDPQGPTYFSYEVLPPPPETPGTAALIRAHGDLDCDCTQSLFELAISDDGAGGLERATGLRIEDEIE